MNENFQPPCACSEHVDNTAVKRRQLIRIGAATCAAVAFGQLRAQSAAARPTSGDLFVSDEEEKDPVGVKAADLIIGMPMLVYPFDPVSKVIRNDSRLNKVVLVKVNEADMDEATKQRSAGGVLAFSAVCTHQACDAKTWLPNDKALVCFCHASKFLVFEGGSVASGPAPRALPMLPLKLQGDELAVAAPFTSPPGGAVK